MWTQSLSGTWNLSERSNWKTEVSFYGEFISLWFQEIRSIGIHTLFVNYIPGTRGELQNAGHFIKEYLPLPKISLYSDSTTHPNVSNKLLEVLWRSNRLLPLDTTRTVWNTMSPIIPRCRCNVFTQPFPSSDRGNTDQETLLGCHRPHSKRRIQQFVQQRFYLAIA